MKKIFLFLLIAVPCLGQVRGELYLKNDQTFKLNQTIIQYFTDNLKLIKSFGGEDVVYIPYEKEFDCTFYIKPSAQGTYVDIGKGIFAIMFPEDGHSPQHYINQPETIKKITVKVSI